HRAPGRRALAHSSAAGLPLSHALPVRDGHLQNGRAGVGERFAGAQRRVSSLAQGRRERRRHRGERLSLPRPPTATPELLEHLSRRALVTIARAYPHHPQLYVECDDAAVAPRIAHPVFFGCFDWHSAVHSHWLLVRAARLLPDGDARNAIVAALDRTLQPAKIEAEAPSPPRRPGFRRPYRLAR